MFQILLALLIPLWRKQLNRSFNDDVAVDDALEDQSLITAKVPASESELSRNDQVVYMEAVATNNAAT